MFSDYCILLNKAIFIFKYAIENTGQLIEIAVINYAYNNYN